MTREQLTKLREATDAAIAVRRERRKGNRWD